MREESHLDDMRSAIRGDFERLAERRGGQELMREPEQEGEEAHESASPVDEPPAAESDREPAFDREDPSEEMNPGAEAAPPEEPRRRSLLDRLLGR